jgi:para-aminobenzoate synthetase/4-amino-4-deoxychorismate lyase
LELSVAIRTFEFRGARAWLGAGGGIVADSVGADEAAEAVAKARPLLAAIGAVMPTPLSKQLPVPWSRRHGGRPVPRPDLEAGLYETARVLDGAVQLWPAHEARLAASSRLLYGLRLPDDLTERVIDIAQGAGDGRIRIDVVPGEELRLELTDNVAGRDPVLRPVLLAGGIGAHKWRDRTLLHAHEDDDPETLPLLIDADGYVLETSRTGIVVQASDGTRWTPPHDGRILPSVTVNVAGARPRRLSVPDLHGASAIYVASALRGIQPATIVGSHRGATVS